MALRLEDKPAEPPCAKREAPAALLIAGETIRRDSASRFRSSESEQLPLAMLARSAHPMATGSRHPRRSAPASIAGSRWPRPLAALIIALALAACGSERAWLIEQGFPPAYAEGYDDGCSSGQQAGGGLFGETRKDANRYAIDSQYAEGWDEGFATCRSRAAAMVRDARLRNPSREK